MKIISNDKLIKRNKKIGQVLTGASLLILAGGLYISFTKPELILISWTALIMGFLISQIGIYFGNRWGRNPRPDEVISTSLKGLDDRFALYHYSSPIAHLLVAPNALWAILPYHQKGRITYNGKTYKQSGGNFLMKFFGQEGIGRPESEAASQVNELNKSLRKIFPDGDLPPVEAVIVFTSDEANLEVVDTPFPTVNAKKLKEVVRKKAKDNLIPADKLESINNGLQ